MCGIGGIAFRDSAVSIEALSKMQQSLRHRGPDDRGIWASENKTVGLVHTRLSIIDLSPAGHQPMQTEDGRYVITFNGEIYNYKSLRDELARDHTITFTSTSDTEVLLYLYQIYGSKCLDKLRGMFAFAIWDVRERTLFLARDPLGIKPLYYECSNSHCAFASEVRTLKHGGFGGKVSPEAIGVFLQWGSVPAPLTMFENILMLEAGEWLLWDQKTGAKQKACYWSYSAAVLNYSGKIISDFNEASEIVRNVLLESIKLHLVSDVPVGAFLSGGVDSSAIVSLMRQAGQEKIATFSIVFPGTPLDESYFSQKIAGRFGTEHHAWQVTGEEFVTMKDEFLSSMDQPTIDGMNTWLVSKYAKENGYKVVTSGVGGDEFFFGYKNIFQRFPTVFNLLNKVPAFILKTTAFLLPRVCSRYEYYRNNIQKINGYCTHGRDFSKAYLVNRQLFSNEEIALLFKDNALAQEAACANSSQYLPEIHMQNNSQIKQLGVLETKRYLETQILLDSDKFSMANGLELRVPFVDKAIAEALAKIDPLCFFDKKVSKPLLVKSAGNIPSEVISRKKQGFALPMEQWIKRVNLHELDSLFHEDAIKFYTKMHWSKIWAMYVLNNWLKESY